MYSFLNDINDDLWQRFLNCALQVLTKGTIADHIIK